MTAFGDPGHAFPAIALGRALVARGHAVCLQTWKRWAQDVEREGIGFAAAPEYSVFPTGRDMTPYEAAVEATRETVPLIERFDPDVVVADILTAVGGLSAGVARRPFATLIPHVLPTSEPGLPPYSIGARLPRTVVGRRAWGALQPLLRRGEERGRDELNAARARVGLPALDYTHNGISRELALVATFPQLEYPRRDWDPSFRVTGPLLWERPADDVELPPGEAPLVLIAPSTSQDPQGRMIDAALAGLADEPVRVIATTNRPGMPLPADVPGNARVVDWLSYSRTMPHCAAVVCHAGHGTVARALSCGVPLVGAPAAGDMAENASRVAWSGCGVALPRRMVTAAGIRLAVRKVLAEPSYAARASELAAWADEHDGGAEAAAQLERLVARSARRTESSARS
ncbi:MAG TPA: nucleotide disphospho-sugar-binding domain-containing protein [Thermoleophilaceae bacterium]|nr:nucleotide disphospho-sugar-binding domain-containing protein [Thermoleophilaceae bacterium]